MDEDEDTVVFTFSHLLTTWKQYNYITMTHIAACKSIFLTRKFARHDDTSLSLPKPMYFVYYFGVC